MPTAQATTPGHTTTRCRKLATAKAPVGTATSAYAHYLSPSLWHQPVPLVRLYKYRTPSPSLPGMHVARRPKIVVICPFSLQYQGKTTNLGSLEKESRHRIYPGGNRLSHRTVYSVGIMQVCCNDGRHGNMLLKQRLWSSR